MINNTLPNKSGNPESLNKWSQQLEISSTNAHIVFEDLPIMRSTSCFICGFVIQVISEKALCSKGFTSNLTYIFTRK